MNRKLLLELRKKKPKKPISEETKKEFSSYKPNRFYLFRRPHNGSLGVKILYANSEEMNKYKVIEAALEKSQYDNRYEVTLSKKEFALLEKFLTPLPPAVKVES